MPSSVKKLWSDILSWAMEHDAYVPLVKDPLPIELQSGVVYRIPCSCGKAYIGETTRRLETRLKENWDNCCKQNLQSSAVADHAWTAHCPIKWEETTIVDRARTSREVQVKEALQIQNSPVDTLLNRDRGLEIPGCWSATIKSHGKP